MANTYRLKDICPIHGYSPMQVDAVVKYFLHYNFKPIKRKRAIARYIIKYNNDPSMYHLYANYKYTSALYNLCLIMRNEIDQDALPQLYLPG